MFFQEKLLKEFQGALPNDLKNLEKILQANSGGKRYVVGKEVCTAQFFFSLLKALADPDLQIRRVGGGAGHPEPEIRAGPRLKKNIFSALRASFWSKNKVRGGGSRAPGPLPWIHHCKVSLPTLRQNPPEN